MARYYLKWKFGEDRFLQQCDLGFADEPIISYVSSQPTYFSTKKAAQAAKKGWCRGTWTICKLS
jgi:hypothetical protein